MTVFTGTVSGASKSAHEELFDTFIASMCGYGTISNQSTGSNVGNGTLDNVAGRASAVTETITLTAQAGGTAFTVSGSVTGAFDDATVDHSYDNGYFAFEISSGGIGYDEGDDFTFDVTQGLAAQESTAWELLYEAYGGSEGKAWLKGPGNSSDDAIYAYVRHFKDIGSGYYNWQLLTSTGYDSGLAESPTNQPGSSGYFYHTMWQNAMDYWLVMNQQRFILVTKVNTNYMSSYLGWILPDGFPTEMPTPLFIGSCTTTSTTVHTNTASTHTAFYKPNDTAAMLHFDGTWNTLGETESEGTVYPWSTSSEVEITTPSDEMGKGPDNGYLPMEGFVCSTESSGNSYGTLDGVFYISGFSNASENTFVWGSSTYTVFQNIFRTDIDEYVAIKME